MIFLYILPIYRTNTISLLLLPACFFFCRLDSKICQRPICLSVSKSRPCHQMIVQLVGKAHSLTRFPSHPQFAVLVSLLSFFFFHFIIRNFVILLVLDICRCPKSHLSLPSTNNIPLRQQRWTASLPSRYEICPILLSINNITSRIQC